MCRDTSPAPLKADTTYVCERVFRVGFTLWPRFRRLRLPMSEILVTRKLPSSVLTKLEAVGAVDLYSGDTVISAEELRARVPGKAAVVSMVTDQIDKSVLDAGSDLKIVANVAVGYNNIDVAHARSRGVIVTNTPDVLTESVADFTWALILAITRRLSEGERVLRAGAWKGWAFDFMLGTELRGKQLGLVGLGRIGRAVATRAAAFGMRVAYTSRRDVVEGGSAAGTADSRRLEAMSIDRLLNTSDIVSLHVPLNTETRHLIDKRALARMKRSAYLINTARGPVIDEEALAWALQARLIAGAALDVYENEPVVHPGLLSLENVLLVPHLGSGTTETRIAMADLAIANVVAVLSGRPPLTPVSS
jgi:glyoxylate reductase